MLAPWRDEETVAELRALHRGGTPDTTFGLAVLFEVMARAEYMQRWEPPNRRLWIYERHPARSCDCGACRCPMRSAAACAGPGCEATILSVYPVPEQEFCSSTCKRAATRLRWQERTFDDALLEMLTGYPEGLREYTVAKKMGAPVEKVRAAVNRLNGQWPQVARFQKQETGDVPSARWFLARATAKQKSD